MSTIVAKNLTVQNSAGTASTNISFDGNKLVSTALDNSIVATANLHDLGVGQTWQDVTASRAAGVTYTNSTGKPIFISITCSNAGGITFSVNDVEVGSTINSFNGSVVAFLACVVPSGSTYRANLFIQNGGFNTWRELR